MKTSIFYFSGTGNSLKIAKLLCDMLIDCELIPIAKVCLKDTIVSNTESVGIIFPLYFWGVPQIVYDFINKVTLNSTNYIFTVITSGGGRTGGALTQINKLLKKKSKKLERYILVDWV